MAGATRSACLRSCLTPCWLMSRGHAGLPSQQQRAVLRTGAISVPMQAPPLDGAAGKVQSGKPPPPPHGKKPLMEPIQPVADYVTGIGARHLGRGYSPLAAAAKQRTATSQPWSSAVAGWRWWLRVLRSPVPAREGRAALAQHTRQGPRAPACGRPAAAIHGLRQSGPPSRTQRKIIRLDLTTRGSCRQPLV